MGVRATIGLAAAFACVMLARSGHLTLHLRMRHHVPVPSQVGGVSDGQRKAEIARPYMYLVMYAALK